MENLITNNEKVTGFTKMSQDVRSDQYYHLYEDPNEPKLPLDSFTAANIGDLSYFTKHMVITAENFASANESGWSPIMYACSKGHALLVSYLLMCGVKTNCCTNLKVTPLMLSIASGDFDTVKCVYSGNDLEKKDYRMWTPLFYAVYYMQVKCVEYLLKKGANVNVEDYRMETPLMLSIKSGNETIVNLILKNANNLHIVSYKNESAIMLAKESMNPRIKKEVLDRLELLTVSAERNKQEKILTPVKCIDTNKENVSTPITLNNITKTKSFLGLKLSKSVAYSPNLNVRSNKNYSQGYSPNQLCLEGSKMSFWNMCLVKSPLPTREHYEVQSLLESLGLEKYWPNFRDEEVDFETLLTFSEHDLKEIGITLLGPRKKIMIAIHELRKINR